MAKKYRELEDGGYYHVIARGNNRFKVFDVEGGFEHFILLLSDMKARFQFKLFHYCLMPNHVHLVTQIRLREDLSKFMQRILLGYSRWYRFKTGYSGYLWQGRFRSPRIHNDAYLLTCGRYVEKNPARAGLVANPGEYSWSSYRYYAYGERNLLIDENPLFNNFGTSALERQRRYAGYVETVDANGPNSSGS